MSDKPQLSSDTKADTYAKMLHDTSKKKVKTNDALTEAEGKLIAQVVDVLKSSDENERAPEETYAVFGKTLKKKNHSWGQVKVAGSCPESTVF